VVSLIRNEADRFLRRAIISWQRFADHILILDDGSTDGSDELALDMDCAVYTRGSGVSAWGTEAPARAELWQLALAETNPGDYIFVLDADMTPIASPRPFLQLQPPTGALAFPLFDLWAPRAYRVDGFWQAHLHPRIWLVKRPELEPPDGWLWPERGMHCGHFPLNLRLEQPVLAVPPSHGILHYAYSTPELREAKAASYASVRDQLSDIEAEHAASILDPEPELEPLRYEPEYPLIP
jgi:hypothetical protein